MSGCAALQVSLQVQQAGHGLMQCTVLITAKIAGTCAACIVGDMLDITSSDLCLTVGHKGLPSCVNIMT